MGPVATGRGPLHMGSGTGFTSKLLHGDAIAVACRARSAEVAVGAVQQPLVQALEVITRLAREADAEAHGALLLRAFRRRDPSASITSSAGT